MPVDRLLTGLCAMLLGGAALATDDAAPVFSQGVISDVGWQWRITFAPDGRTAYFARSDGFFPATRQATIMVSVVHEGAWSAPEVASFSGRHPDMDPAFSPDGQRLFFSSVRDGREDIDLFVMERRGEDWSEPLRLDERVNTPQDELYPSVSADGTLYFARGPLRPAAGAHFDIFSARREGDGFSTAEPLPAAINTAPAAGGGLQDAWEFNPEISPDGRTLLFASLRPGGAGVGDLYLSRRVDGAWTPARNLGAPVNTAADEYHPTRSPDGRQLYFVRRGEAGGDFHAVPFPAFD